MYVVIPKQTTKEFAQLKEHVKAYIEAASRQVSTREESKRQAKKEAKYGRFIGEDLSFIDGCIHFDELNITEGQDIIFYVE